ncbi:MAG: GNAT family N-acetyltransferase [Rhizobiaceae bacterium]|nr:GNAT family N-acetyltransferase [Rhizobiaceae bacterium]
MVQIRDMITDDAKGVSDLLTQSWRATYEPVLGLEKAAGIAAVMFSEEKQAEEAGNPDITTIVAICEEGSVCGVAMTSLDTNGKAWIDQIHVAPSHFGTGVADDLMRAVFAKHTGLPSLSLSFIKGNGRAQEFYERHGFQVASELPDWGYMKGIPSVVMTKILQRS